MTYTSSEARQELLDSVAEAGDELAAALAALGDAYEQLDEDSGDRLEETLFRPVQTAYGRVKQTHSAFAARHGAEPHDFAAPGAPGAPSRGVRDFVEAALDHADQAEAILVELQDSGSTVAVGDAELRAGIADVRRILAEVPPAGERFLSGFGR